MMTDQELIAARNAAADKTVQVRYAHLWPSMRDCLTHGREPIPFFHVVSGDYAIGSTVTLNTLLALGLRVEVVE